MKNILWGAFVVLLAALAFGLYFKSQESKRLARLVDELSSQVERTKFELEEMSKVVESCGAPRAESAPAETDFPSPYSFEGKVEQVEAPTQAAQDRELESPLVKQAKAAIFAVLIDPTAPLYRIKTVGHNYVCGEINSKNRMGGYTGYKRFFWRDGETGLIVEDAGSASEISNILLEALWKSDCAS